MYVSLQYKNCVCREKISSESKNLIALILINNTCCSKQKRKNQKDQNVSEWNHDWKTGTTKKHVLAYFQNFSWLTNSSIIFKWMAHHTIDHTMIFIHWLLFTFYITYTYNSGPPEQGARQPLLPPQSFFVSALFERSNQKCTWKLIFYSHYYW